LVGLPVVTTRRPASRDCAKHDAVQTETFHAIAKIGQYISAVAKYLGMISMTFD
jgi:hypothetical protein